MLTALLAPACQTTRPLPPAKQDAEQRWNAVRAKTKLQLAAQHAERGLFEEALAAATESIALNPAAPDGYALAARAQLELGQLASAQTTIHAAQGRGIQAAELTYLSGVILEQRGETEAAVARYRQARSLGPPLVDYLAAEAECLVALGKPEDALVLLDAHRHTFDDDATIAALAGRIAELLGRDEEAIGWYRQALARQPESRAVAEQLGTLLARSQRCAEAIALLRPSVREASGEFSGAMHRALAGCYLLEADPISAGVVLADYLADHPEDAGAQLLLAQAAIATDDSLTANRALFLAEKHKGDDASIALLRAAAAWLRGDRAAAETFLVARVAASPADQDAACFLASVRLQAGDSPGAAKVLEAASLGEGDSCPAARHVGRVDPDSRISSPADSSPAEAEPTGNSAGL